MSNVVNGQERSRSKVKGLPGDPLVVSRENHNISRAKIDPDALKVMYRLIHHDYQAFLVGGGVRDLLLGKQPKDFDIGTDARPEQMRKLFRNSRVIGRRFRLVHVYFRGGKILEVSTFRQPSKPCEESGEVETLAADNTYGDPETDAVRRDLTINGLFYDLSSFSVIDYVGGVQDLQQGIIRVIGDPWVRYTEDPVRMIRAIRHAARAQFEIEQQSYRALVECCDKITECSTSRLHEEFLKELRYGACTRSFVLFEETGLLRHLAPPLAEALEVFRDRAWPALGKALAGFDRVSKSKRELRPAILFLSLFVGVVKPESLLEGEDSADINLVSELWSANPFHEIYEKEGIIPSEMVTKAVKYGRSGVLTNIIDRWFKPLGVSRREREVMEELMIQRLCLYGSYYGNFRNEKLLEQSINQDAIDLLSLTAKDSFAEVCLDYWQEQLGRFPQKRRSSPAMPGGQQRRRGRGGRSGGSKNKGKRRE